MKVLAGFTSSPEGAEALAEAQHQVRERGGELHLVAFMPNPVGDEAAESFPIDRKRVQASLDEYIRDLDSKGLHAVGHLPMGARSASRALLGVAEQEEVDLIVIGIRNRSRVGKLILGSTTQEVLLRAHCPVLAVKAIVGAR